MNQNIVLQALKYIARLFGWTAPAEKKASAEYPTADAVMAANFDQLSEWSATLPSARTNRERLLCSLIHHRRGQIFSELLAEKLSARGKP